MTILAIRALPQIESPARAVTPMIRQITNTCTPIKKVKEDVELSVQEDILVTTRTLMNASYAMFHVLLVC